MFSFDAFAPLRCMLDADTRLPMRDYFDAAAAAARRYYAARRLRLFRALHAQVAADAQIR